MIETNLIESEPSISFLKETLLKMLDGNEEKMKFKERDEFISKYENIFVK